MKKYLVKIPKDILVIYSKKNKIIVFINKFKTSALNLKNKITVKNKIIEISPDSFFKQSNKDIKKSKILQGTTTALIKQTIIELMFKTFLKIKLIGVGYKVFLTNNDFLNKLICFKLGFSHLVFFKAPSKINFFCMKKNTKLYIFGKSYSTITQLASSIRQLKKPDSYKGKGILYENEKVLLKRGKKI